ncbi:hypothetical protein WMY93_005573 [Mugilogobius chulae]|uniref:Small monomeric GTPase n=1 Tax=Mugilogobius chulae TaxID=88201 RepID=A0AAW0PWI3_9GOBI
MEKQYLPEHGLLLFAGFKRDVSTEKNGYYLTAGVELLTKCVSIPESEHSVVRAVLLDCPGKELLTEACEKMWVEPWLMCLVFDLSSEQSFLSCSRWLERLQAHSLGNTLSGVVVGNKSDLSERRVVSCEQAQEWAQSHGLDYHETSAKELDTCLAPLLSLAQTCLSLYEQSCERTHSLDT